VKERWHENLRMGVYIWRRLKADGRIGVSGDMQVVIGQLNKEAITPPYPLKKM